MTPPLVVTGHGRSGTHWLAHVLGHFVDARHEPPQLEGEIVVDCRQWRRVGELQNDGHKLIHLVRDGREVVRSTHSFYHGRHSFEHTCREWAEAVEACKDLPTVRLKDLLRRQAQTQRHTLAHWSEWDDEMTDTFWRLCGEQMARHGYER